MPRSAPGVDAVSDLGFPRWEIPLANARREAPIAALRGLARLDLLRTGAPVRHAAGARPDGTERACADELAVLLPLVQPGCLASLNRGTSLHAMSAIPQRLLRRLAAWSAAAPVAV